LTGVREGKAADMQRMPMERLRELANADSWLVHRGRYLEVTFLLEIGTQSYLLRIHRGRVDAVERGPFVLPRWTFALKAARETWEAFWAPNPPVGFHDLIAMLRFGRLVVEGDQYPFMANLRYFKDLLALPRAGLVGSP
jgi:hypothetical protein